MGTNGILLLYVITLDGTKFPTKAKSNERGVKGPKWDSNDRNTKYSVMYHETKLTSLNLIRTKRRLLYLKTQFAPRSKNFSSLL